MKKIIQSVISIGIIVLTVAVLIFHTGSMHAVKMNATAHSTSQKTKTSQSKSQSKVSSKEKKELAELPKNAKPSDWDLLLVSGKHPLPDNYHPEITTIGGFKIDKRVKPHYEELAKAAKKAGYPLTIVSVYRSVDYQKQIYQKHIDDDMAQGMSKKEAEADTANYMTKPGTSEHHTGLSMDVLTEQYVADNGTNLSEKFGDTKGGKWLVDHCAEYGFIIRYPKDKYEITKIKYEPWHLRYVGKANAEYIMKHHISLEEYIDLLKKRDEING